jgi:hypothetical protein
MTFAAIVGASVGFGLQAHPLALPVTIAALGGLAALLFLTTKHLREA